MASDKANIQSRRAMLTALGTTALAAGSAHQALSSGNKPLRPADVRTVPAFSSLTADKSLRAGMFIQTLGYFQPGDSGAAAYEITGDSGKTSALPVGNGLFAVLLPAVGCVNYRMFGARSDGRSDDGIAIKHAHLFANEFGLPVLNLAGEFWIRETRLIPVTTNVNWGNTVFHLDESFNSPREAHFVVLPRQASSEISLSAGLKAGLIQKLKPGVKFLPELAAYRNCLVIVKDENDRVGRRYGPDYNPRGWAREEFFYVEEHGRIIGDMAWTFSDYTHLTAYPCDEGYLTIEGGTFLVSGDNPGKIGGPYHQEGIAVRRSRTIIRNQWVGLEKGKDDVSDTPRGGFYNFSCVYDILLENIRLIPWEKDRPGTDRDLKAGTYGIGGSRVLCGTFRNITAEGSPIHWGVFGTNLFKNFRIESCRLNRVDVHFHGWNIAIKDSEIGQKGLTLTGGGELVIENTRVFNNVFLNFRQDYGARWDGPISIVNCRVMIQTNSPAAIISMLPGDFDYKYPIVLGQQIVVSDFTFVSLPEWNDARYSLIRLPKFSNSKEGGRLVFPQRMAFSHVIVQGRERGLQLLDLPDVSSFLTGSRRGGMTNGVLQTNCTIHFEDIVLDHDPEAPNLYLGLPGPYADANSLYPYLSVVNCAHLKLKLDDVQASVFIKGTEIEQLEAGKTENFKGKISFENCNFRFLQGPENDEAPGMIRANTGISFTNCEINIPLLNGLPAPELLEKIDFLKINGPVRHNHLNTRLGADLLAHLSAGKIKLKKEFIGMLRSHHELEDGVL